VLVEEPGFLETAAGKASKIHSGGEGASGQFGCVCDVPRRINLFSRREERFVEGC
jgi:hypothetical protein